MEFKDQVVLFNEINGFKSIANFFNIPDAELWDILINKKDKLYTNFSVKKKDGSDRIIHVPNQNIKNLQIHLKNILNEVYRVHPTAFGFVKGRSLKEGAESHLKQESILSIDIKDFFPTIHFGRVKAMFESYFKFNYSDASTLASICCLSNGELPQGAPTSPIISNIISNDLDKKLNRISRKYKCVYTRYADDITISSQLLHFPQQIAKKQEGIVVLSDLIKEVFEFNGFEINERKTRLKNKFQSMSVTGVKVNEKMNVNRSYIRKIRSILNCIEKNGTNIKEAEMIFAEKYRNRKYKSSSNMFRTLRGMIDYVGHIKGNDDLVFNKLAKRYNTLANKFGMTIIKRRVPFEELVNNSVFPIFGGDDDMLEFKFLENGYPHKSETILGNGTGFYLDGIGIVTSAHLYSDNGLNRIINAVGLNNLIMKNDFYITLQRRNNSPIKAKILKIDYSLDIAILSPNIELENGFQYNFKF